MAEKKSNQITYSTAENFNPLQDYNVGYQVTQQSQMHPEKFGGKKTYNQFHYADIRNLNRPTTTQDLQAFTANVNAGYYGIDPATNEMVKSTTFSQPTARYETKDSARIAAQHNAGITYDRDIGYVPKAARIPSTPEQITQRSRDNTAAREASKSPADMAAYRANTYQKEAARKAAAGDPQSAARWKRAADQEATKARQLGYRGDISKATIKDPTAKPNPPSASTPKPSTSSPAPQQTSGIDWEMTPPKNATEEAMRQNDMAIKKANTDSAKRADDKFVANQIKGHMKAMDARDKQISDIKGQFETNDKIKDLKGELASDRQAEQNWKTRAAKATTPAEKEHALQMAGEYADKAKKREAEIAGLEKGSKVPDIKPIAKDKDKKPQKNATDPMADLMAGIPTMNNSSAYNTGGAGGGSGVAGFFTRPDGTVVPITA